MSIDKTVTKDLVETLRDGETGFAKAADKLASSDKAALAQSFRRLSAQRTEFAAELEALGAAYGDDVAESGSLVAKAHRGWMAVKDTFSGSDAGGVVDAAVSGENHTVSEYEDALTKDLSDGLRVVVERQAAAVKLARDEVKALQATTG